MIKNLFLFSLIFVSIFIFSCNKGSDLNNIKLKNENHNTNVGAKPSGHVDVLIFEVDLRRNRGKNRDGNRCNCSYCLGFCNFHWFWEDYVIPTNPTVGVYHDSLFNRATIYFLKEVDSADLAYNPTYYIDEDIMIRSNTDSFKIQAGQYTYTSSTDTVKAIQNGIDYMSLGYIDVLTD